MFLLSALSNSNSGNNSNSNSNSNSSSHSSSGSCSLSGSSGGINSIRDRLWICDLGKIFIYFNLFFLMQQSIIMKFLFMLNYIVNTGVIGGRSYTITKVIKITLKEAWSIWLIQLICFLLKHPKKLTICAIWFIH